MQKSPKFRPYRGGAPENPHNSGISIGYPPENRKFPRLLDPLPPRDYPWARKNRCQVLGVRGDTL